MNDDQIFRLLCSISDEDRYIGVAICMNKYKEYGDYNWREMVRRILHDKLGTPGKGFMWYREQQAYKLGEEIIKEGLT